MHNYNIKAKHMATMTGFFTAKNFELSTRNPTPPPNRDGGQPAKGKTDAGGAGGAKGGAKAPVTEDTRGSANASV